MHSDEARTSPRWPLAARVGLAWVLVTGALAFAGWAGETFGDATGAPFRIQHLVQGLIMSGLVVPGVLWLRYRVDRRGAGGFGLGTPSRALSGFAVGFGIIAVPMFLVLTTADLLGWVALDVDLSASGIGLLLLAMITAVLFEALPEELGFRGYIYHHLSTQYARWAASGLTVLLFVLCPIVLVEVQDHLLGMEVSINGSSQISTSYIVTLVIFGSVVQYLRVVSGVIWVSVGFHLASLMSSRISSPNPGRFIHVTEVATPGALQTTSLAAVVLGAIVVLAWPKIRGTEVGWTTRAAEVVG